MKASDYIIDYLLGQNIDRAYGYIGGMIVHLVDSIYHHNRFTMVNMIHEQGAAFAAEGDARVSGKTAVALATSGPGATNLITGIGSCFFDSVPVLFITGQVNTYEYKNDLPIRQRGFQETDVASIVRPITKYSTLIQDANALRYELEKAFFLTQHGRKGPVLLDIPMDVQRADIDAAGQASFFDSEEYHALIQEEGGPVSESEMNEITAVLRKAQRPLVLVGGGCSTDFARRELNHFLHQTSIPVVCSLMGLDIVGQDYPYHMGLIGSYGNRYGNLALANADVVLVLGSRLDTRQTGTNVSSFARAAHIIRVDIDRDELAHSTVQSRMSFNCEAGAFLQKLNKTVCIPNLDGWYSILENYKKSYPSTRRYDGSTKYPNLVIKQLSDMLDHDDIVCVDVGQHQMWVAQSLEVKTGQRVLFSGGMGAMGFALPSSIGACVASGKRVVVITGDGGMQMNIQELEVLARRRLPIKVVVMNNSCLGMVRQFQETYFGGHCPGTVEDYSAPDFVKIASAYKIDALSVPVDRDARETFRGMLQTDGPCILNLSLELETDVEPKLIVNKPLEDMSPPLDRDELGRQMIIPMYEENHDG